MINLASLTKPSNYIIFYHLMAIMGVVLGCANIWVENGVTLGLYGAKYGADIKKRK